MRVWETSARTVVVKALGGSSSWADVEAETDWRIFGLSLVMPDGLSYKSVLAVAEGVVSLTHLDDEKIFPVRSIPVNGSGASLRLQHPMEVPRGGTLHVELHLGGEPPWPTTRGVAVLLHGVELLGE